MAVLPHIHLFPGSPAHSHCGCVGRGFATHFSAEQEGHEVHEDRRRRKHRKAGESLQASRRRCPQGIEGRVLQGIL